MHARGRVDTCTSERCSIAERSLAKSHQVMRNFASSAKMMNAWEEYLTVQKLKAAFDLVAGRQVERVMGVLAPFFHLTVTTLPQLPQHVINARGANSGALCHGIDADRSVGARDYASGCSAAWLHTLGCEGATGARDARGAERLRRHDEGHTRILQAL